MLTMISETLPPTLDSPGGDTLSHVTANGLPSHRHTPVRGWVTLVTAGLLARESSCLSGLPGFPVATGGQALVAHSCGDSQGLDRPLEEDPIIPVPFRFPYGNRHSLQTIAIVAAKTITIVAVNHAKTRCRGVLHSKTLRMT